MDKLTDAMCFLIACDMQPFDTVTDPGFRHLLGELEPRYVPQIIATNYMPRLFEREKQRVKHQLSSISSFAVTTRLVIPSQTRLHKPDSLLHRQ